MSSFEEADIKAGVSFIDFSEVYEVTKVEGKGDEATVYYKPAFPNHLEASIEYTEPLESFLDSNKRLPISKKEAQELLSSLGKEPADDASFNINSVEAAIKYSDITALTESLRLIKLQRVDPDTDLSFTKKRTFRQMSDHVAKEFAVAMNIQPDTAMKRMEKELQKISVD